MAKTREPAEDRPVARVAVDVSLPHLDRTFDYLVPTDLAATAGPGCRVRVRFAGQLVDGFILDRASESDHAGKLSFVERLTSAEPVLRPEIVDLARAVADRYAGSLADVLRLAVPPRHAAVEKKPVVVEPSAAPDAPDPMAWQDYPSGPAFLRALASGRSPRAVFTVLPGGDWPARFAEAAIATAHSGRGAVLVVPDARDLDRVDAALGSVPHVTLQASVGPAERYRRFLRASREQVSIVAGTRAAMFAPVASLGLVAIWDDGDDLYAEQRAPYPHAREVLLLRAQRSSAAALVAAHARTAEAQLLLETGWAREIAATRDVVRLRAPAVAPTGDDSDRARDPAAVSARLPSLAWKTARDSLLGGAPVLVQVPRRGYVPSVSCMECRTPARCTACSGPLALPSSHGAAFCRWCGRIAGGYTCPECGGRRLWAAVIGARRTAEELGRAFPDVVVRTSGRDGVLDRVSKEPAVVVATPGAEPMAEGGYGAVLLLDTWALLTRTDLRAGEEAVRRWFNAAALARSSVDGGRVVLVADGGLTPAQALLRWDPATFAGRELAERRELQFPPAARMASVTGSPEAVADFVTLAALPAGTELLGPVPAGEEERLLVRVGSRSVGAALAASLHQALGVRSARKARDPVRVQVDPLELF